MWPREKVGKNLMQVAKECKVVSIRRFHQHQLLSDYNPGFFTQLIFDSPSLDQRGVCYGLVAEWYQHQRMHKDLFQELKGKNCDVLIKKIDSMQKHHKELCDGLSYEDQPLDRGGRYKYDDLWVTSHECQENWIKKGVPHSLLGVVQPLYRAILDDKLDEKTLCPDASEERQEFPKDRNTFFGKSQIDFNKIIDDAIDEEDVGSLKEIFIISSRRINHFIGFVCRINEKSEKEYVVFDPNFGECIFKTLRDSKDFLNRHIALFYKSIDAHKGDFARVDITTYSNREQMLKIFS